MESEFQDQGNIFQDLKDWLSPTGIQLIHSFFSKEYIQESINE